MKASEQALNLLRTAMQIERDGYAFYTAAAAETKDSSAVKTFLSLARDEMEHLGKLEIVYCAVTKGQEWPSVERGPCREIRMIVPAPEKAAGVVTPDTRELAALKRGVQAERDSIAFYRKAIEQATDPQARAMYEYLIEAEEAHLAILSAEYDYLVRSGFWFDHQEFTVEARD